MTTFFLVIFAMLFSIVLGAIGFSALIFYNAWMNDKEDELWDLLGEILK